MRILGCDSGFRSFGYAILSIDSGIPEPLEVGVIRTKASVKKRRIRKADDNSDRTRFLWRELCRLIALTDDLVCVGVESVACPFGKARFSVVSQLGRARALVDCIAENAGVPIVEESPQRLKELVTGSMKASKADVIAALEKRFPALSAMWPEQEGQIEHAADAVAAALACMDSDAVKAALRARKIG